MGTFAALFQKTGTGIPDDKKEEFRERVEKLYRSGGMMELERVELCGRKAVTMRHASMHDYGMDFYYNYFEDTCWENAGFNLRNDRVWSEKIGWAEFHQVVVAAYVLESLYVDGPAVAMIDNELVTSNGFIGWINYLFKEHYSKKNEDPWALFEEMHGAGWGSLETYDWEKFVQGIYGVIGYYEILAVLSGSNAADEEFRKILESAKNDNADGTMNFFDFIKRLKMAVTKFHEESERSETEQLSIIMKMLRSFYEQDKAPLDVSKKYEDKNLESICFFVLLADAPAYLVKVISETYDVDFWELWEQVKDVAKRRFFLYETEKGAEVMPFSTMDFFGITSDDMILFWGDDDNIRFSQELEKWFDDLKSYFEKIVEDGKVIDNPLYWILDLMEYADENYYRVYTFSDFFQETVENLNDRRFLALWRIYDEMLHDPRLEEAGSVIFVPEGAEYENVGLHYLGTPPRRRLKRNWDFMSQDERFNKARVVFRRYMALLGNRKLREKVFGF